MANSKQIIELYTQLAQQPSFDFGWEKGLENAKAHGYSSGYFTALPKEIWDYCAAVGNPFALGVINEGETVVDLGCGAGVDLLISALKVGKKGRAIGVDITPKMVEKSRYHAKLAGVSNVEVLESSFDTLNIEDESVDVVISNGAINLTSCKESVFAEIHRILKPDGRLMFADMIDISEKDSCAAQESTCCDLAKEDWANCVAGTLRKDELIEIIRQAGFTEIECVNVNHYSTSDTTRGATFKAKKIASSKARQSYWDNFFNTKEYTQVLWHQETPAQSLKQIQSYATKEDNIIDVGCGASLLVDNLIDVGYKNISLLDTSLESLDIVKNRLANHANLPTYICSDIILFTPKVQFNVWHDRAMFHFLVNKKDRNIYFEVLKKSLLADGIAIINTFAIGGETQCAGLSTEQYDSVKIKEELPLGLSLLSSESFVHTTPKNTEQKYNCFIIKKA